MSDHIIKAARSIWGESAILPFAELERFYAIAYRQGMERSAEICDEQMASGQLAPLEQHRASFIACAIRAHAKNPPKNEHDGGDV